MPIRYPPPLLRGDLVAVTAPSSGVPADLRPRLDFCLEHLRSRGYRVLVGQCLDGAGIVSAPARERAAELTAMLTDPQVRAVVPPWGGELAVEVLPHLDWPAIAAAEPTWLVGYSDLALLQLALTTRTGWASLHGQNLMDTAYRVPEPLLAWLEVAGTPAGGSVLQGASRAHRLQGFDRWQDDPTVREHAFDATGGWRLLHPSGEPLRVSGRLIGGCIETVSVAAGTAYGDVPAFARQHAPEGLIVHVETAESGAPTIARDLWRMRLAGWFESARAVLVGRTTAPAGDGLTQEEAIRSALGDLGVPVVLDVDCGHVQPHLALVNGALAELTLDGELQQLRQTLS